MEKTVEQNFTRCKFPSRERTCICFPLGNAHDAFAYEQRVLGRPGQPR